MYQSLIIETLRCTPMQARLIEAWMRLEHGTLDHLDRASFKREARIGLECALASTASENESLAQSFGLAGAR